MKFAISPRAIQTMIACALSGAAAAEPWDPGEALDTCLLAAVTQRPGIVTGWRQVGGGAQPPYAVSVLNRDGKIAEATCEPANPSNLRFEEKMGIYRYSMYERADFAEVKARVAAPTIFVGPVRMQAMELSVGLRGTPHYVYQLFLPSGHKASVRLDGVSGRLVSAEVK